MLDTSGQIPTFGDVEEVRPALPVMRDRLYGDPMLSRR